MGECVCVCVSRYECMGECVCVSRYECMGECVCVCVKNPMHTYSHTRLSLYAHAHLIQYQNP